jgi:hypothetical protein
LLYRFFGNLVDEFAIDKNVEIQSMWSNKLKNIFYMNN